MKKRQGVILMILAMMGLLGFMGTWQVGFSDDAISPWTYSKTLGKGMDVDWSKTSEGKTFYNEQTVKDFKAAGLSHVRIRVSGEATPELLKGLDQQISDCLKIGLIPIIAYQADDFKNDPGQENMQSVVNWWSIVANRYKNTSHRLSFDLLIEATDALNKQPDKLNDLYEQCVTEIRKTNPKRIIMISPRLRSDPQYLKELKLPTHHNGYIMAEWHFYAAGPSQSNEAKLWTIGTVAEKALITQKIQYALDWQKSSDIPTWVGAWMPGNYNDGDDYSIDEQVQFSKFVTAELSKAGIPFAVNSDTKFYDREKNTWLALRAPVFKAIFNGAKASDIKVGFNAKGNMSAVEQCNYFLKEAELLKKEGLDTSKLFIRLQGGTSSQKTLPSEWTNEEIALWAKVQKSMGCHLIFVVNFNDTAESQAKFYKRLTGAGMKFDWIELGNEQYLKKFSLPKTGSALEVTARTERMTPEKYIVMSNGYIQAFKAFGLPYYVQFAANNEDSGRALWNQEIAKAINTGRFLSSDINGTLHLYERSGLGSLDVKQISSVRAKVNRPMKMAITEFGVSDDKTKSAYSELVVQEKVLTERILTELKTGDTALNQLLYTDYKTTGAAVLHSTYKGITPKGKAVFEAFKNYLKY